MSKHVFNGTLEQQELASKIFRIMKLQGSFYSAYTPIRQTLDNLVTFLSEQQDSDPDILKEHIDAALRENANIFKRDEENGEVIYTTSRVGVVDYPRDDMSHTFKQRLYEPEQPLPVDDISVVISTSRPVLTSVEPAFVSDYWQEQAEFATVTPRSAREYDDADAESYDEDVTRDAESTSREGVWIPEPVSPSAPISGEGTEVGHGEHVFGQHPVDDRSPVEGGLPSTPSWVGAAVPHSGEQPVGAQLGVSVTVDADSVADTYIDRDEQDELLGLEHEESSLDLVADDAYLPDDEVPEDDVVEPEEELRPDTTITLPDGTRIDLSKPSDVLLKNYSVVLEHALVEQLDRDPLRRIVHFGRSFYPESGVVSLGKNDLRRIRDYIIEVGEPLLDTAIIADLYYHNPRHTDYEGFRFSLNYRLSREKDFEFVGVEGARLWSTKGLSVIGTKRVKISEMGQLTSFLIDFDDSSDLQSPDFVRQSGTVDRLITFFEWEYGILPLDASLAALFPEPMLLDQRSAVLRIESPQHYTNFLVELRYPMGNRGGWVQGFEDFFHEHLISGAFITLTRTDEPNVFTITYEEIPVTTARLLTLDEKKNKFAFADVSYYCNVDEEQMLEQKRFGKLKNLKSLPMSERRKTDVVMKHVFETVGERQGSRDEPTYCLTIDEVFSTYNVLRPVSLSYIRALLEEYEEYIPDDSVPDIYYYQPEPEPVKEDDSDDDDNEEYIVGGRRWTYGDDDE